MELLKPGLSFFYNIIARVLNSKTNPDDLLRLLAGIYVDDEQDCWFRSTDWTEVTRVGGISAHRLSYKIFKGPLKQKHEIYQTCKRSGCINPDHLYQNAKTVHLKLVGFNRIDYKTPKETISGSELLDQIARTECL